jgi:hypothetical protein
MTNRTKAKDITDIELVDALRNLNRTITNREEKLNKLKRRSRWLYRILHQRFDQNGNRKPVTSN